MSIKKFTIFLLSLVIVASILFPAYAVFARFSETGTSGQTSFTDTGSTSSFSFCPGNMQSIGGILNFFTCLIIDSIVPLLMGIATMIFIWGIIQYVINAEDTTKRAEGRS